MTTLTTAPLAPLLDRLFAEADAATSPALSALSGEERDRPMRERERRVIMVESPLLSG